MTTTPIGTSRWGLRSCSPENSSRPTVIPAHVTANSGLPTNGWGECGLALMDLAAGWDGLLLSTTAALAAVYAWIVSRLLAAGLHGLVVALWITITIAASTHNFLIRPHMATLVLLGVVFGILTAVDHRRVRLSQLWWFVPMMLVWSNTHGGAIGGLGTIAIVVAVHFMQHIFSRRLHSLAQKSTDLNQGLSD